MTTFMAVMMLAVGGGGTGPSFPMYRELANRDTNGLFFVEERPNAPRKGKQMFFSNLSRIDSIDVYVGQWTSPTDTITVTLSTPCGQHLRQSGLTLSHAGKTSPYWVRVNLSALPVQYGQWYVMEVTSTVSKLGVNVDRFSEGRRFVSRNGPNSYNSGGMMGFSPIGATTGQKKQDLMFVINGSAMSNSSTKPVQTTNVLCSDGCFAINPERAPAGSPKNALNVMFREVYRETDGTQRAGSFYNDDITALANAIRGDLEEGDISWSALKAIPPFDTFYENMNVYIARKNPATDPEFLQGFTHCANIDVVINISTGLYAGALSPGDFEGMIGDPRTGDHRVSMMHEVFGHGFSFKDQYVHPSETWRVATTTPSEYSLDSGPIGCSNPTTTNWCYGTKPVTQLIADMASDPNRDCWGMNGTQCTAAANRCYNITGLNEPYYGGRVCVPRTVVSYDVGVNCAESGGCYIGSALGSTGTQLDVAQPHLAFMQAPTPFSLGYGPLKSSMEMLLKCVFDATDCTLYNASACHAFIDKWDGADGATTNARNRPFLLKGKACEAGVSRRR